jgi:2-oxoglutarate/2-oxoacid ferredoxin oxidoreductase subunit alpha
MHRAVHLSEKYQLPVFVLSDAYIAQRREIRGPLGEHPPATRRDVWSPGMGPARFDLLGDHGVTPFRVPGTPEGTYLAAGIEHTEEGYPTADGAMHHRMNRKRFQKLDAIAAETREWFRVLGRAGAAKGIVAWGSQYGLLEEWVGRHDEFRVFLPEILHPFPLEAFEAWRENLASLAVLEMSYQGQLYRHLAGLTNLGGARSVTRSGGMPLQIGELERLLEGEAR